MTAVLSGMKLPDGRFWPLPVMLAVPEKAARGLAPGQSREPAGWRRLHARQSFMFPKCGPPTPTPKGIWPPPPGCPWRAPG
jgi:hypothetical protein